MPSTRISVIPASVGIQFVQAVVPAQAGIQLVDLTALKINQMNNLDSGVRRNDSYMGVRRNDGRMDCGPGSIHRL